MKLSPTTRLVFPENATVNVPPRSRVPVTANRSAVIVFFFFQAEDGIRDGRVTGVQTCAFRSIAASAKLTDTTDEMWDRMLRVNASGAFYCTRAVLPMMLAAKWGRIVNMASVAGRAGAPYIAAYTASKHALLGLTRAVAAEVASRGITVNAVCPGYVDTEMTDASAANIVKRTGRTDEDARKILEGFSPQRRLMTTPEVAAMTTYLCSEVARGINGQGIVIDGGALQS